YMGADSFTYAASDGCLTSADGTVSITVTDNQPTVQDTSTTVLHGQTTSPIDLIGLSQDADAPDQPQLAVYLTQNPQHGVVWQDSNGMFYYQADVGYMGADSFTYAASDGYLTSADGTVSITVTDNQPMVDDTTISVP